MPNPQSWHVFAAHHPPARRLSAWCPRELAAPTLRVGWAKGIARSCVDSGTTATSASGCGLTGSKIGSTGLTWRRELEWLEAGDRMRIQWTAEVVALRLAGHDKEVQREEERLVDPQALKALRGGAGESYRQSLQALLSEQPEGLTFRAGGAGSP